MQRPWWLLNTFHRPYQNGSWPLNRIHMVVLVGALLAVAFWMALILRPDDGRGRIEVGRPSPISIQAERSVSFVSDLLTEQARATAENSPENIVYRTDQNLLIEQQDQLNDMLRTISNIRNDPSLNSVEKREELVNLPTSSVIISDTLADAILNLNDSVWSTVQRQTRLLFTQALDAYDAEIDDAALRELRTEQLPRWVAGLPQLQRDLVLLLTNSFLRVNHVLDEEATERQKLAAREAVTPVVVDVQAGESIVRVGEIVTPRTIEILEATDTLPDQLSMFNTLGLGIIAAMLSFTTILHISFYHREIAAHPRQLLVIVGLLIITALAGRLLFSSWEAPPYTFPLAAVVLAITIVFNSQLALVCAVVLSIMVGLMQGDNQLPTAVTMLLGSGVAVVLARGAERPGTLLIAGAGTTVATVLSQIGFTISTSIDWQPVVLVPMMTFSLVNGVLSALLAWGMFYVVATLAGIITAPQLMELSHPSRPLLRKLMREAPGTYYHSISVANLAEAAAEAVAADALLLRVAAFYHDIGKTIRPYFFTDNQTGRENVHNELDPQISAAIIIDHVREGVKMARAAGLPQSIIDFIATHHGTHLVAHFYQLALRQQDTVDIEDFRYPGPIPFTREQGILMLADSVEATVRAKAQHGQLIAQRIPASANGQTRSGSHTTIEDLVASIIDERVRTGQLDNTALTLRELVLIREAFVSTLQGIYHPRTEYAPQLVKAS